MKASLMHRSKKRNSDSLPLVSVANATIARCRYFVDWYSDAPMVLYSLCCASPPGLQGFAFGISLMSPVYVKVRGYCEEGIAVAVIRALGATIYDQYHNARPPEVTRLACLRSPVPNTEETVEFQFSHLEHHVRG